MEIEIKIRVMALVWVEVVRLNTDLELFILWTITQLQIEMITVGVKQCSMPSAAWITSLA